MMKRITLIISFILLGLVGFGFTANKIGFADVPAEFRLNVVGGEGTAIGYVDSSFDGNLVIPATAVQGGDSVPITGLAQSGKYPEFVRFMANSDILSLDLSQATNLKTIGEKTFYGCSNLTGELYLPANLLTIEKNAFASTKISKVYINRLITEEVDSDVVLTSDGYTNIHANAFPSSSSIEFVFASQEMLDLYKDFDIFSNANYTMTVEESDKEIEDSDIENPEEDTNTDEGTGTTPENPDDEETPVVPAEVEVTITFDYNYDTTETLNTLLRAVGKNFRYEKSNDEWSENSSFAFPSIERNGCNFMGWSLTQNGEVVDENTIITENMINNGNVTLYAIWEEKFYEITYNYSEGLTPSIPLPTEFGALTGVSLPSLTSENILIEWKGWYLDSNYTNLVTEIPAGTTTNIQLWSKYIVHTPQFTIQAKLLSGEDLDVIYFDDEVKYDALITNYPSDCDIAYEWKLLDTTWANLGNSKECVVGSKLSKEYQIKCIITLSKNGKTISFEKTIAHKVEKWKVDIDWKDTPNISYTGEEYIHKFDIIYPNDYVRNSCRYKTYVKVGDNFVECDKVINAGEYKIVVEVLEGYRSIVEISDTSEFTFKIEKSVIETSYDNDYHQKEYDGVAYVPHITLNDENWSDIGFDLSKITETIYHKRGNSYYVFAKHSLSEKVNLEQLKNAGQYYFELSIEDENYQLSSPHPKQIILITQKHITVTWKDVNLVYNGKIQNPTASAVGVDGHNLSLEVKGGQTNANDGVDNLYTATAILNDNNYVLDNPTCDYYISKVKTYIVSNINSFNNSKLYDGKKFEIRANVYDNNGEVAENVVVACDSDLTSVGAHRVVLSWAGDKNHFAPNNLELDIIIKTENIVIDNDHKGDIVISSSDGFNSNDEVVVENNNENLVSKTIYNSLSSAYDIHNIYRITNSNSKDLTISLALPEGITSTKQLKVFEITQDGEMKEVEYLISNGSISLSSSSQLSTFAVVCVKDASMTGIILGCLAGLVAGAVVFLLVIQSKRKKRTNL